MIWGRSQKLRGTRDPPLGPGDPGGRTPPGPKLVLLSPARLCPCHGGCIADSGNQLGQSRAVPPLPGPGRTARPGRASVSSATDGVHITHGRRGLNGAQLGSSVPAARPRGRSGACRCVQGPGARLELGVQTGTRPCAHSEERSRQVSRRSPPEKLSASPSLSRMQWGPKDVAVGNATFL